jgi:signal peptidase II
MSRLGRYWPFLVSMAVFALDRLTKWLIRTHVSPWDNLPIIPGFFSIVHTENRGAAFGILSQSTSEWRTLLLIALSLAVMVFITMLLVQPARGGMASTLALRVGLALVLGGALGNVYDRVHTGAVTDFLEFYYRQYQFPAFNVADSAITTGAGLLLLDMWLGHRRKTVAAPVGAEHKHVSQTD